MMSAVGMPPLLNFVVRSNICPRNVFNIQLKWVRKYVDIKKIYMKKIAVVRTSSLDYRSEVTTEIFVVSSFFLDLA